MNDARAHTLFRAWEYISANPQCTVRQLQHAMGWQSPSTAHRALESLEKLEYVSKPCRKQGARKVLVTATYLEMAVA